MLEPYSKYFIWLTASTRKGESPPSDKSFAYTDTASELEQTYQKYKYLIDIVNSAPDVPQLVNISIKSSSSVLLEWASPKVVYRQVDLYMIRLHEDKQFSVFNATDNHVSDEMKLILTALLAASSLIRFC